MALPVAVGEKVTAADINSIANLPVATSASLPASGNWLGRQIAATNTGITWRWDGSAWVIWDLSPTTFTPTWTNLTVGAGSNTGSYTISGGIVRVEFATVLGAGFSVGAARLTLPISGVFSSVNTPVGRVAYIDNGTGTFRGDLFSFSSTQVDFRYLGGALFWSAISSTTPFTWASTDSLLGAFTYRAA